MTTKKFLHTALFLFTLMCFLLILLAQRFYVRLDISHDKRFSLSPFSKEILLELDEKMEITYYVSPELQTRYPQVRDISDFLFAYQYRNKNIHVTKIDPAKEKQEQSLIALGIVPQQIQTTEKNQTSFITVFSGITLEYQGNTEIISFVLSPLSLEYDVSMRIKNLLQQKKIGVQIIINNDLNIQENYQPLLSWLEAAGFYTRLIDLDNLAELSLMQPLMVLGANTISLQQLESLEQFVMQGGRALFAVTQNATDISGGWSVVPIENSNLIRLLEFWGIQIQQDLVLDVANFRITMESQKENTQYEYINYPFWINVLSQNINQNHALTKNIYNLQLFWPSSLLLFSSDDVVIEPLFSSSSASWLQTAFENQGLYITNPFEIYTSAANPKSIGSHVIGASLEGRVNGYVLGGKSEKTRLIVVGDQYCFSNFLQYTNSPENFDFLVNAVLWLSEEEGLLSLREKTSVQTEKTYFENQDLYGQQKTAVLFFHFLLIPLGILSSFVGFLIYRKKKS